MSRDGRAWGGGLEVCNTRSRERSEKEKGERRLGMYSIIRGAIVVQLAEYYGLSKDVQDYLEYMAMSSPDQINDYIDERINVSRKTDEKTCKCLRDLKQAISQIKRNLQFHSD